MTSEPTEEVGAGQPLVSVIVATYNMAKYLSDAVESILGQTYGNLDLHVVDDGSTDDTGSVMQRWAGDSRVHYHWQPNAGQTNAKNNGVRESKGEFIAFCDADDMWTPDKLRKQMMLFDPGGTVGVVYARNQQIRESGSVVADTREETYYSGRITGQLFQYNFICFGTTVTRRICFDEFGGFNEDYRMGIDWDLWLRISTRYEIRFLDDIVYLYRVWPGQMSTNWRGRYEHALRIMGDFLQKYPDFVDVRTISRAYAHTYAERARLRALLGREIGPAYRDVALALRYSPLYLPAWKMLARLALIAVDR